MKKLNSAPSPSDFDPRALTANQLAKILSAGAGNVITVEMIERDLVEGAPANGDGTVNLIHFGAWLVRHVNKTGTA
ncbi:MAG TPA: hypothetical protein PKA76_19195 [Pirellulaceae bacterium]|nr:hypothetical protein [Pirellulaceae bacterium]